MSKRFSSNEDRLIAHIDGTTPDAGWDFVNKRGSVQRTLQNNEVTGFDRLKELTPEELEEIIKDIDFFEKHGTVSNTAVVQYFRNKAEFRVTIADIVQEKGLGGLRGMIKKLPKQTIH